MKTPSKNNLIKSNTRSYLDKKLKTVLGTITSERYLLTYEKYLLRYRQSAKLARKLMPVINIGFASAYNPFSEAIHQFMSCIYCDKNMQTKIHYPGLKLTPATVSTPFFKAIRIDKKLEFTWFYSPMDSKGHPSDYAVLVAICDDQIIGTSIKQHFRFQKHGEIELPDSFDNKPIHCYLFFNAQDNPGISKTGYYPVDGNE